MGETKRVNISMSEADLKNQNLGKFVEAEIEIYLKSDKTQWDKEYLFNQILEDYQRIKNKKIEL